MTKCYVIYDEMGYSTTTAKVEFESKESAKSALNELNEAEIEGIAIKLELVSEEYFRFQTNKNLKRREFK
jgi:hypothetical protein